MSEEVTKIIDTLCEKLGVAASYLIPELARMHIAQNITTTILCAVILIVLIIAMKKMWVKAMEDNDPEIAFFIEIIPGLMFVGVLIFFCNAVTALAGWLASPTAMAIKEITAMIK